MDSVMAFVQPAYEFVHAGFSDVRSQVAALIIAAVAAFVMSSWGRLWATALAAVVVHILVGMLLPVLQGGAFTIPDFIALAFWANALALYVGYVLVIAFFFFLKHNVFRMGRSSHAHGHAH